MTSSKMACQFCGKEVKTKGKGPHETRCSKNPRSANYRIESLEPNGNNRKYMPMFERDKDGLWPCPWCDFKAQNAQGLGAHGTTKHHKEFKQLQAERGHNRNRKERVVAASIHNSRTGLSNLRGKSQRKVYGVDLTSVPTEKLPLLVKAIRQELEARFKQYLAEC